MLFAAIFEAGAKPQQYVPGLSYAPPALPPASARVSALPPSTANAAEGWKQRPQTAEILQPSSVTDHTTKLLEKSERGSE